MTFRFSLIGGEGYVLLASTSIHDHLTLKRINSLYTFPLDVFQINLDHVEFPIGLRKRRFADIQNGRKEEKRENFADDVFTFQQKVVGLFFIRTRSSAINWKVFLHSSYHCLMNQ